MAKIEENNEIIKDGVMEIQSRIRETRDIHENVEFYLTERDSVTAKEYKEVAEAWEKHRSSGLGETGDRSSGRLGPW